MIKYPILWACLVFGSVDFKSKLSTRKEICESGSEVIIQQNKEGNQLHTLHIWVRQDTGNFELRVTK